MVFDLQNDPTNQWKSYNVSLVANGWDVGAIGGPDATVADMLTVLTSLQEIYIRAEYRFGPDIQRLDNPRLACTNVPASLALGIAIFGILLVSSGIGLISTTAPHKLT